MRSGSGLWRRSRAIGLIACIAVTGCGEAEKSATSMKSLTPAGAVSKAAVDLAVRSGETNTAMVNGEAQKGVAQITPGTPTTGSLTSSDGKLDDGSYFDAWMFDVPSGGEVLVALTSDDFDTYLSLVSGKPGGMGEVIDVNDDLDGTNSGLAAVVEPGTYTAIATSFSPGATGSYDIVVITGEGANEEGRVLRPGGTESGTLTRDDPTLDDGSHYHVYTLQGQAGDRVTISLSSTDFDTYLGLRRDGELLIDNDDAGATTNSQIEYTLPSGGAYEVVVTSFEGGETGAYQVSAQSVARAPFAGFRTGGDPKGRYALLVGIGDYPGSESDLGNAPIEDANIVHRALVERFGFDEANIVTLNDADATRENIAQGIAQHLGQAGPDGVAVFFYSGHGTQIGENIGVTGSLDPENAEGDQAIYVYGADYRSSVIVDEELGYLMETLDAGRTLVLVDACFSGTVTRASGDAPRSKVVHLTDPGVAELVELPTNFITSELKALNLTDTSLGFGDFSRIADVMRNPQRHVLISASSDEQVSWTSQLGGGSSVFTYYLGQRLMSDPMSTTLAQLHDQVHDDVTRYIAQDGNMTMQDPQIAGPRQTMTLQDFFRQR
jgi:hypothetical protein